MKPGLLIISEDAAWRGRLEGLARGLNLPYMTAHDERVLKQRGDWPLFGIAVLDWASGEARGWASALRRRWPGCILALAGSARDLAADGVSAAVECGADGFLAKEAAAAQLGAQLLTLWRRGAAAARECALLSPRGDLRLNPAQGRVSVKRRGQWRPGPALRPKERALLQVFLEQPGRILDRAALLEAVWGERCTHVNAEALDKQVACLRRKLGPQGRALRTVHSQGYCWQ